jgi:hypothetical protein
MEEGVKTGRTPTKEKIEKSNRLFGKILDPLKGEELADGILVNLL